MPIFSIWIAREVMLGLLSAHGQSKLAGQESASNSKAEAIYRVLDANPEIYQPVNDKSVRSRMNICFRSVDDTTEKEFLAGAEKIYLQGLKGHRSVVIHASFSQIPLFTSCLHRNSPFWFIQSSQH